jgi:hypothetical protein
LKFRQNFDMKKLEKKTLLHTLLAGKQAFYYRLPVISIKSRGRWPDLITMAKEDAAVHGGMAS